MDWLLILLNFIASMCGAWICIKVQQSSLPAPATLLAGCSTMIIWSLLVKYSHMSLPRMSAWYDVATTLGYFTGYAALGVTITTLQWIGVLFLIIGLFLINA